LRQFENPLHSGKKTTFAVTGYQSHHSHVEHFGYFIRFRDPVLFCIFHC